MADWDKLEDYAYRTADIVASRIAPGIGADIEDVRQELLLNAWRAACRADNDRYPKAYVARAVANRGRQIIRAARNAKGIFARRMISVSFAER